MLIDNKDEAQRWFSHTRQDILWGDNLGPSIETPDYGKDFFDNKSIQTLIDFLMTHRKDDTSAVAHEARVEQEMTFFITTGAIGFVMEIEILIQKFKRYGVVWGVGRGSSCASYVLYLLDVHEVNPIKYDIDFIEFAKIPEEEYM